MSVKLNEVRRGTVVQNLDRMNRMSRMNEMHTLSILSILSDIACGFPMAQA